MIQMMLATRVTTMPMMLLITVMICTKIQVRVKMWMMIQKMVVTMILITTD